MENLYHPYAHIVHYMPDYWQFAYAILSLSLRGTPSPR